MTDAAETQAICKRIASAVNRDQALRPFFLLVGINTDTSTLRCSLRRSADRAKLELKIHMIVEVSGMPRHGNDTIELVNDKVMDDYLPAELERLLPDLGDYSYDVGVEIGPPSSKPTRKSDHED